MKLSASFFMLIAMAVGGVSFSAEPTLQTFFDAANRDEKIARQALSELEASWQPGYAALLIDLAHFAGDRESRMTGRAGVGVGNSIGAGAGAGTTPTHQINIQARLLKFLKKRTGASPGTTPMDWSRWLWQQPETDRADYREFKRTLLGQIDPRMADFLVDGTPRRIREDEILWGGTKTDGIPALDHPTMIQAGEAGWLHENDVVFGVINGEEARAYPQRIVAWHELVRDRLGDEEITLAYCTLCNSAIPWKNDVAGKTLSFVTSGLLYRSNKLMADDKTNTLWSALQGKPLLGPLAGFDVSLEALPIVVTSWGQWQSEHPDTTVLSIETGFDKDYDEGAAYASYRRSKRILYEVPKHDKRLRDKTTITAFTAVAQNGFSEAVAIDDSVFTEGGLYSFQAAGNHWLAVRDAGGGVRVYQVAPETYRQTEGDGMLQDSSGVRWRIRDEMLIPQSDKAAAAPRQPTTRVYWFGWFAQYPETLLFKN